MDQTITCISCPVGCRIQAVVENGSLVSLSGNACKRGEAYARQECIAPKRMVTAVIPVAGSSMPLSVKTKAPIPKGDIKRCMKELNALQLLRPIHMGQVVLANVCNSGVDIVATKQVP